MTDLSYAQQDIPVRFKVTALYLPGLFAEAFAAPGAIFNNDGNLAPANVSARTLHRQRVAW
ncbi:MAG: hypothetical protein OHK0011_06120 [Turneriella sp.]